MVRYANRSRTAIRVPKDSTPCVQPTISPGSLHAPYGLLPLLAVGKVMIKAGRGIGGSVLGNGNGIP